jgi:hypothetical protein
LSNARDDAIRFAHYVITIALVVGGFTHVLNPHYGGIALLVWVAAWMMAPLTASALAFITGIAVIVLSLLA